jgi:hypothetical protein
MGRIQGTAVATFDSAVPVTLDGEWNIDVSIPVTRSYGQGDGTPGSGYNGSALGTKMTVSGSFSFIVTVDGEADGRRIERKGGRLPLRFALVRSQ